MVQSIILALSVLRLVLRICFQLHPFAAWFFQSVVSITFKVQFETSLWQTKNNPKELQKPALHTINPWDPIALLAQMAQLSYVVLSKESDLTGKFSIFQHIIHLCGTRACSRSKE
uniref:Secreted protein n=1 Tax=Arion vulgaris TaxID=1028688 RepID=A0A0B7B5J3_9EUPU